MKVRLMLWAGAGECRLAKQSSEGWAVSAPLSPEALHEALGELAAGRSPAFAREGVVVGLVGADDITDLAAPLLARLGKHRRESSSQVRLLCWMDQSPQEYRFAEPCDSGWKISAPLAGEAIWRAMRALARGRMPKFAAVGVVSDLVGCDEITRQDAAQNLIAESVCR